MSAHQRQATCKRCGKVLAVRNPQPGCSENFAMGLLVVCTLGVGLVIAIPWAVWRGIDASRYRCPTCGGRAKPRLFG